MDNQIENILNKLKKPCNKIIFKKEYEYWEEIDKSIMSTSNYIFDEDLITDEEGRQFVFQVVNFDGLNLPKEIGKLSFYYHLDDENTNIEISKYPQNYIEAKDIENKNGVLFFEDYFNLPDWETLKNFYKKEYEQIKTYIKAKKPDLKEYAFYEIYDELVKEVLGYENYHSFVGGNLNQIYHIHIPDDFFEEYRFIMQIQTDFSNGEVIYIFQSKKDSSKFIDFLQH